MQIGPGSIDFLFQFIFLNFNIKKLQKNIPKKVCVSIQSEQFWIIRVHGENNAGPNEVARLARHLIVQFVRQEKVMQMKYFNLSKLNVAFWKHIDN